MKLLSLFIILLASTTCFGQTEKSDKPQPDRWRGMVLNESTPEQALELFGKPKKDSLANLRFMMPRWVSKEARSKKYREIHFEDVRDFRDVKFYFDDGRLIGIWLEPSKENKLPPANLSKAYGLEFVPVFSGLSEAFNPRDFKREQGKTYARKFPVAYQIVSADDSVFVFGAVDNSSFGSIFGGAMGVPDQAGNLPGKIMIVQLISRKLENMDGVDSLK